MNTGSLVGVLFLYGAIYLVQAIVWGWATNKIVENKGYRENWFWWGFFFGLIALIVALTKPNIQGQQTTYTPMYGNVSNNTSSLYRNDRVATGTEWKCAYCRRINQAFVGTCACGHSRSESEEKRRREQMDTQALLHSIPDSHPGRLSALCVRSSCRHSKQRLSFCS